MSGLMNPRGTDTGVESTRVAPLNRGSTPQQTTSLSTPHSPDPQTRRIARSDRPGRPPLLSPTEGSPQVATVPWLR
jgi:hypothetical protein